MVGVITNACLIAFTSQWGSNFDLTDQLIIVIAFEVRAIADRVHSASYPAWEDKMSIDFRAE